VGRSCDVARSFATPAAARRAHARRKSWPRLIGRVPRGGIRVALSETVRQAVETGRTHLHISQGGQAMRKILGFALALVLAVSLTAWAGEIEGKIQKVDTTDRSFTLEDGTQIWVAEGVPIETLKEGSTVKATYEERDGKKVATTLEVSQ
jgi:Protein of unknown function (DUF1344)